MALSAGTKLGPYEIESAIGAGGMGEVYKARDTRLDRVVAIKVLPTHLSERPDLRERFDREAKAISKLSHSHICALYDVGHEDGVDFLVMEYLDGETLGDHLAKEKVTAAQLLRIGTQIAEALDTAHQNGIVHRDLKPGNIMLTASGVKLLDFGLAKVGEMTGGPAGGLSGVLTEAQSDQPLTAEGTILGTLQYMAPEQLEGREADARTDLFALGAILYEMATGKKAFAGASQASLISSIMGSEPSPLSAIDATSPPALDWVIRTCLSKNPNDRFRSAHDLQLQLQWIQEGSSQIGVPAGVARKRVTRERIAWAATLLLLVVSAISIASIIRTGGDDKEVVRAYLPAPEGHNYHFVGRGGPLALSPDGRFVTFSARDEDGKSGLWLRPLDALTSHPIAGTEDASYPFWSPDSRFIAFFVQSRLKKVDAAGGPPVTLCTVKTNGRGGSWSQEGSIIIGELNSGVHRVPAAGGEPVQITFLDTTRAETTHRWPSFLPDGKHFLYYARISQGAEDNGIWLGSLDDSEPELLIHCQSNALYTSGHLLYLRENTLMAHPFDPGKREFTGEAIPAAEQVQFDTPFSRGTFTVSEDGDLAYQPGGELMGNQLAWVDREGNQLSIMGDEVLHSGPHVSPGGKEVVVAINDPQAGSPDLWIYDVDRGIRTRFTYGQINVNYPTWSPDGKQVVYASSAGSGKLDLYRKPLYGISKETLLLSSGVDKHPTSWTPDGKYIVFHHRGIENSWDLAVVSASGEGEPREFLATPYQEDGGVVSPDGRWIAYASTESGTYEIYVTSFPEAGRKWQISTDGGDFPRWRGDGQELFYMAGETIYSARVTPGTDTFIVGEVTMLFPLPTSLIGVPYDVTHDGERFLVGVADQGGPTSPAVLVLNMVEGLSRK
jgi:serine/threonine protein kinase